MAYWYTFYFGLLLKKRVVDTELNFVFSSQYFSYIVAVSFTGGRNRSTRKKPTNLSQVTDKVKVESSMPQKKNAVVYEDKYSIHV
jgi:hypothetical protein